MDTPDLPDAPQELQAAIATVTAPATVRRLDELFDRGTVTVLSQIAEPLGFRLGENPDMQPGESGYVTNLRTGEIFYPPGAAQNEPPLLFFGRIAHELGHHDRRISAFQDACARYVEAAAYQLPAELAHQRRLIASLENVDADIVLESVIPERAVTRELFSTAFRHSRASLFLSDCDPDGSRMQAYEASGRTQFPWSREEFEAMRPYEQLIRLCLVSPFFGLPPREFVHDSLPDFERLERHFAALRNPWPPDTQKGYLLVETARMIGPLIQQELDAARERGEQGITEFQDDVARACDRADRVSRPFRRVGERPQEEQRRQRQAQAAEQAEAHRRENADRVRGVTQAAGSLADQFYAEQAARHGVTPETYREFDGYCRVNRGLITVMRDAFIEFALRDFRIDRVNDSRTGPTIAAGREVETYFGWQEGADPATMEEIILKRNPRTMHWHHLIDVSGSMLPQMDQTLGYFTTVAVATFEAQEEIRRNPRKYFVPRVYSPPVITRMFIFSDGLGELPVSPHLTLKEIMDCYQLIRQHTGGGGTNDVGALEELLRRMLPDDPQRLQLLSVITDGWGAESSMAPVLQKLDKRKHTYFLVNAVGSMAANVRRAYRSPWAPGTARRVIEESGTIAEAAEKTTRATLRWTKEFFGRAGS